MSCKTFLVSLWALLTVAGIPLAVIVVFPRADNMAGSLEIMAWLCREVFFAPSITRPESVGPFGHAEASLLNPICIYVVLALSSLVWSLFRWFRNPRLGTWLWTVFCGWVLCGIPGLNVIAYIYFFFLCAFKGFY